MDTNLLNTVRDLAASSPVLAWGLPALGFTLGALLTALWRGLRLKTVNAQARETEAALHESQLSATQARSERDLLKRNLEELKQQRDKLQHERDRYARAHAALDARQQAESQKHREQLALLQESRAQLRVEFEHLSQRIFEERSQQFRRENQHSVEALLKPFGEQIQRFQSRVNEVHEQSVRGNESLASELRQMMQVGLSMSDQAENLSKALKGDNKTAGSWGEMQLERTLQLAGLEEGTHYEAQAPLRDSEGKLRLPDFLIKLPDDKHLVIDSKVSLVAYDRAVAAESDSEREVALKAHTLSLKRHIQDLAGKDYSALPGIDSPELEFLFVPVEAAYIEALKFDRELFNEGYRQNIILVSHTTLLPMLRTVASLWMSYRANKEAREIASQAGEIYNKVRLVGLRLEDMGKTLATATDKYNNTVTALVGKQGLYGKIERLRNSAANARGELPEPATQHANVEHDRLGVFEEEHRLKAVEPPPESERA